MAASAPSTAARESTSLVVATLSTWSPALLPARIAVLTSWGIAFFEYWLAVPANRYGSAVYSTAQLKTMQEVITLLVFAGFSVLYLGEALRWNHVAAFGCLVGAAYFAFK